MRKEGGTEVKSEQGAGVAVSQEVIRPRVLELRVSVESIGCERLSGGRETP